MTDPIREALQLQEQAKLEGVDVLELIEREMSTEETRDLGNPFLDENGQPYHDMPEED